MQLDYAKYFDKVLGTWIGKCAGGILGAPIEGVKDFNKIKLSEKLFETNYPNDDLDLQLLWLDMVKKKGPEVRENDFAEHWLNHVGFPWNEYGIATRNLRLGLFPPDSGNHNNYYYHESMGCPIRSEIWGLLNPGDPARAAFYAGMDASTDHSGFSVEAEKFLSACTAIAFFESDVKKIFKAALNFVSSGSMMHRLVTDVMKWSESAGFTVARGKIKSYYGDADFTSAPMNVGFTLLVLLEKGNGFNCVMDALHMGHDSDCIAATAGALIGTISGYNKIPGNWKKMVGDGLLVSSEIKGIVPPSTITELAEQTCRAGLSFISTSRKIQMNNIATEPFEHIAPNIFHLKTIHNETLITFNYENLTDARQDVKIILRSHKIKFHTKEILFKSLSGKINSIPVNISATPGRHAALKYTTDVFINGRKVRSIERGVPQYGSWLLAGPFIEDDKALLDKYFKNYPEHGLSSLPSVQYMNHDKINTRKDFLSVKEIRSLADDSTWLKKPYLVKRIFPSDFRMIPDEWYYGNGERTIYLYSKLNLEKAERLWVCLGASAPFKLSINGKEVGDEKKIRRAWIGNTILAHRFKKGENHIVIRLDLVTDKNQIEIGFKEFTGKHPHQEQWSLRVPFV